MSNFTDRFYKPPQKQPSKLASREFAGLVVAQGLGSLNDNALKQFILLIAVFYISPAQQGLIIALASLALSVPYLIFSSLAGSIADKYPKRNLVILYKCLEVVIMGCGFFAFYVQNIPMMLVILFLMGTQSAFFSPVKYSMLPHTLEDRDLSDGNGILSMFNFVGIITGLALAGVLADLFKENLYLASFIFVSIALIGVMFSLWVANPKTSDKNIKLEFNFIKKAYQNIKYVRGYDRIFKVILAGSYFWFSGALLTLNLLMYAKFSMKLEILNVNFFGMMLTLSEVLQVAILNVCLSFGIGLGSFIAGKLSRGKVELGIVPLGIIGMILLVLDLAFSFQSLPRVLTDLFLLGIAGGFFILPLQTYVQQRSPNKEKGKFIATANILNFIGILSASIVLWFFIDIIKISPTAIFLVHSLLTVFVFFVLLKVLPELLIRFLLYPLVNFIYRIKIDGQENIPVKGGALFVSNHMSFIDGFLLAGACQRPIRFVMNKRFYDVPVLKYFFKVIGCIPISRHDSPRKIMKSFELARKSLKSGDIVCIFVEGQISRHGQMLRFKKGYEYIGKGINAPIIPVYIDGVWGSLFSYKGGKVLFKRLRLLYRRVTVGFGKPLKSNVSVDEVRHAVQHISTTAFENRIKARKPLAIAFLNSAKKYWFRTAVKDSEGKKLSFGMLLIKTVAVSKILKKLVKDSPRVAVLIPPSIAGCVVNLAVSALGKSAVNLNYTFPRELALYCAKKADCKIILTSQKVLDALGWKKSNNMVLLEDLVALTPKISKLITAITCTIMPTYFLRKTYFWRQGKSNKTEATIIFTSGSTGEPKGVMLSHKNIHANIEAVGQILEIYKTDKILGTLPFFHSFGYTATLWLPLLTGFSVIYHNNPLDAKIVGDICEKNKATMLIATPTFLNVYLKKISKEKFKSLRIVVTGAEKLRNELAYEFEKKFGIFPMEGYGTTELAPVVSVNIEDVDTGRVRQKGKKIGTIGHPLPGIAVKVIDVETGKRLPPNQSGILCVKGPNLMMGYLNETKKTKEVIKDEYYITGDIASIDEDGFITITDRISRFSKIAGEMVPHIKIEEILQKLSDRLEKCFVVSAVLDDKKGERLVVLYKDLTEQELDKIYKKFLSSNTARLWIPARKDFYEVDEFPILGSGKLDLAGLKETAKELAKI